MPANQSLKDSLIETGKALLNPLGAASRALKSAPKKSRALKSAPKKSAPKKSAPKKSSHPPLALKGHGMEKANHGLPRNPFAPPNSNQKAKPPPDPRERATVNRGKLAPTPPKGQGTGTHPNRPKSVGSYFGAK